MVNARLGFVGQLHRELNAMRFIAVGNPLATVEELQEFEPQFAAVLSSAADLDATHELPRRVIIDLRQLEYLNGITISVLIRLFSSLRSEGVGLVLLATGVMIDALKLTQLQKVMTLVADENELLQKCGIKLSQQQEDG
jgi:anti-anti-sigma factor